MATLIDGKATGAAIREALKTEVASLKARGITPGLAVILVGNDDASRRYVGNKKKGCEELSIYSEVHELPQSTTQEALLALIETLNQNSAIHGILVQLPLPKGIDEQAVIRAIDPSKDVDAFCLPNVGRIMLGEPWFLPCTPAGIMELLAAYEIPVEGRECVVIGRSNIVGKPMAMLLMHKNGTVTVCHSRTKELAKVTARADILVSAIGKANFVTGDMVKPGAVVIDVGMNRDENGKLCGDVDFAAVEPVASYITPVPGGVGPMTITMLLKNTVMAAGKSGSMG